MKRTIVDASTSTEMALPDLGAVKTWALGFAGTAVIVILILRMVHLYAKKAWGEMIVEIIAGTYAIFFCFANDQAIQQLKDLGHLVFG